jgi:hypothetical protein
VGAGAGAGTVAVALDVGGAVEEVEASALPLLELAPAR